MANRYANLVGANRIKDEYTKINTGFDAVQAEMDAVNAELDAHKADTIVHVTQAEHDKLAGIEPGAQVKQNAFSRINDVSATTEEDTVTFQGGTGIAITTDPATKRVIWTATGQATPGPHATSHITGGTDVIPDAVANASSGLMSGADKAKLDAATSADTPNTLVQRDENAQAKFGTPTDNAHAATKEYVDGFFEEGTWTPTLAGLTTPGNHTYSAQGGYYTRIRNVVVATFLIRLSAKDTNMAGSTSISGLPFATRSESSYRAGGAIAEVGNITLSPTNTQYVLNLFPNSTRILIQATGGSQPQVGLSPGNITDSTVISGTIVYHTN